jgi:hypothetical protein
MEVPSDLGTYTCFSSRRTRVAAAAAQRRQIEIAVTRIAADAQRGDLGIPVRRAEAQ